MFAAKNFLFTSTGIIADYLIVAGGGAGGNSGGGGGAGGYQSFSSQTLSYGVAYTITVGAGGATNGASLRAGSGSNSVFNITTSAGGGGGGSYANPTSSSIANGANGGSGGGGAYGGHPHSR